MTSRRYGGEAGTTGSHEACQFVRGPRGGLYIATNKRERSIAEMDDDWMTGTLTIVDKSDGVRYVRPNSKLAQRANV